MRILLLTPHAAPDIGGPATHTKMVTEFLPRQGFTIEVVSFTAVHHLPKGFSHLVLFFQLLHKARKADVVYALDPVSIGFPASLVARLLGKPFFVRIAGDYAWEQGTQRFGVTDSLETFVEKWKKYSWRLRLFSRIERWVARQAKQVIVPSVYLSQVIKKWGVQSEKISVAYNGVGELSQTGQKEVLRQMLGMEGKVIVSAGRLIALKNFEGVVEAVRMLRTSFPDVKLLIIGEGPSRKTLEGLIKKHKLEDVVILTGRLDRRVLFQYVKASDIFVLNSWHETFSHLLLEVMTIGTPIVTTNVGGTPEILENGKEGILIPPRDNEALKSALKELLESDQRGKQLVQNAHEKVKKFSVEKEMKVLISIFRGL